MKPATAKGSRGRYEELSIHPNSPVHNMPVCVGEVGIMSEQLMGGKRMNEQQIEGVPDGWRLVRIGTPKVGEYYIENHGEACEAKSTTPTVLHWVFPIIEKIETPKQHRPFANAAEFEPHRDRWVEYTSPSRGDSSLYRVSAYTSERVWLGPDNAGKTYKEAFHCLRFDDGTPFGVEVTE